MFIAVVNEKGGVGKSTLAVHLATWLFDRGAKVALLDCDKQRSSSQWIAEVEPQVTVAVVDTPEILASEAQGLRQSHDFLVGDGPAGLADISRTLLLLADLAIFPISPSILDLRSVAQATSVLKYAHSIKLTVDGLDSLGRTELIADDSLLLFAANQRAHLVEPEVVFSDRLDQPLPLFGQFQDLVVHWTFGIRLRAPGTAIAGRIAGTFKLFEGLRRCAANSAVSGV